MWMYEQTKGTTLGKEQKKTAGIKAGEIPDVENKDLYTLRNLEHFLGDELVLPKS